MKNFCRWWWKNREPVDYVIAAALLGIAVIIATQWQ